MNPTTRPTGHGIDDRTARARIREAAVAMFAEHGVAGTSIRGVADAAGVSPGLVQHHFRSKDRLREECDAHVVETVIGQAEQAVNGEIGDPGILAAMYESSHLHIRYIARALVDGSPGAARLFDVGAALAEKWMTAEDPDGFPEGARRTRDSASAMAAMHLGTIVLHEHLSRRMETDTLTGDGTHRVGMAMFDVYRRMAGYLDSDTGRRIQEALTEFSPRGGPAPPTEDGHDD